MKPVFEIFFDEKFINNVELFAFDNRNSCQDFFRFLETLQGVRIFSNKKIGSIDEIDHLKKNSVFWRKLLNYSLPEYDCNFLPSLISSSKETGFKLFFIEREDTKKLSERFGYYFFNSTEIPLVWNLFSPYRDGICVPITDNKDCNPRFNDWSYFNQFRHPINSLLLCDRYILQDKRRFRSNLFELLRALKLKDLLERDLEIIIISELRLERKGRPTVENDIEEYAKEIERYIRERLNLININFIIIKLYNDESFYREHDRSLISNYWYINPQTSFNFFYYDQNCRKTFLSDSVRSNLDFRFNFNKNTRNLLKDRISVMGQIVANAKDSKTEKRVWYSGSSKKKSRLLGIFD